MSRRPGESAASWYERAIVAHSVAASHQETFDWNANTNPAALQAITQRLDETAADLKLAAAAFRAERAADSSPPSSGARRVVPGR